MLVEGGVLSFQDVLEDSCEDIGEGEVVLVET
jgi:hypothetical protein